VVEDEGQIVGCWAVTRIVHVEGVWIDPQYRRRSVRIVKLLFRGIYAAAKFFRAKYVWTGADTPEVERLLEKGRRAYLIPFKSYVLAIPQEDTCPQDS
jgi:hypothetical protein